MDYKIGLLGRILLLAVSLFLLSYFILNGAGVFAISLFIILVLAQIIFLLGYAESSFKKVRQFLNNIKQDNYANVYPVKFDGTDTDDLHIEFNAILAKLKEDQAEKEANYQYFRSVFQHLSIGLITFDEEGNCNHCTEFIHKRSKHKHQGAETDAQFKQLIQKIKEEGKGKPYDCVVGLSGGIDSSYVAYICKQNGLRVLAVHLDNGWNSEEAVQNIKNIARKLEIDYESYVLDWEEFKDIQLAFLKASVPEAETPTDIAIQAAMHKIAAKYDDSPLWLGLTYNSHPVSLAASLAVVNIYESDNLIENANKMGAYLEKRIEALKKN